MSYRLSGTFARVWLTRLKDAKDNRSGIYALKVLRKADGKELKTVIISTDG